MSSIVNYYEKLHLSQDMAADDIDFELIKLEKVWRKRELSQPEKAADMIGLIKGAKEVFKSEDAKKAYDEALRKSMEAPAKEDPDSGRKAAFEKWAGKAEEFFQSGDTDLAESAMEKALQYYDEKTENDEFLAGVAQIYFNSRQPDRAVQYINKAIMIDQSNWEYLLLKGNALRMKGDINGAEESYRKAGDVAGRKNDVRGSAYMQGILADFLLRVKGEHNSAHMLAGYSVKNGDPSGLAAAVLKEIESPKAHAVTPDELKSYAAEQIAFTDKIGEVASEIISKYKPVTGDEWPLCMKTAYYKEIDDGSLDFIENDEMCRYKFVLRTDGNIRGYSMTKRGEKWGNWEVLGGGAERILTEMDFDAIWSRVIFDDKNGIAQEWLRTSVVEIWNMLNDGKVNENDMLQITRKSYQKGKGLYTRLVRLRDHLEAEEQRRMDEAVAKLRAEEEAARNAEIWKSQGRCRHCGGEFRSGVLGEKCSACGMKKDY